MLELGTTLPESLRSPTAQGQARLPVGWALGLPAGVQGMRAEAQ